MDLCLVGLYRGWEALFRCQMDRVRGGQEGLGPREVSPTCPDGGGQEEGCAGQAVLSFLGRLLEPVSP